MIPGYVLCDLHSPLQRLAFVLIMGFELVVFEVFPQSASKCPDRSFFHTASQEQTYAARFPCSGLISSIIFFDFNLAQYRS